MDTAALEFRERYQDAKFARCVATISQINDKDLAHVPQSAVYTPEPQTLIELKFDA